MQPMGFTEKHVRDIYDVFKKLDTRNVGKVQASKLMKQVTFNRVYGLRIFCPIGRGEDEGESSSEESSDGEEDDAQPKIKTKRIACPTANFLLFVSSIWFYCTCTTEDLVNVAYIQYDLDKNKKLTMMELNMLISELYTAQVTANPQVAAILSNLRTVAEREEKLRVEKQILRAKSRMQRAKNNKEGRKRGLIEAYNPKDDEDDGGLAITPKVFMKFLATNKMLVKPLQQLQFKLRAKLCGLPFWENEAKTARMALLKDKCGMPPNVGSLDRIEALRSFLVRYQKEMVTTGRVYVVADDTDDENDLEGEGGDDEAGVAATSTAGQTSGPDTQNKNPPADADKKGTFITVSSDDDSDDDDSKEGPMAGRRRRNKVKVGVGGSVL